MKHSFCLVAVATLFVGFALNGTEDQGVTYNADLVEKYKKKSHWNRLIKGGVQKKHIPKDTKLRPSQYRKLDSIFSKDLTYRKRSTLNPLFECHRDVKLKDVKSEIVFPNGSSEPIEGGAPYDYDTTIYKPSQNITYYQRGGLNPERLAAVG